MSPLFVAGDPQKAFGCACRFIHTEDGELAACSQRDVGDARAIYAAVLSQRCTGGFISHQK